jgi:Na+/H+ antiporter NhaD/arsenite permease-like protein
MVNGLLLATYLVVDKLYFYRQERLTDLKRDRAEIRRLTVAGWRLNGPLLVGVVLAVALLDPKKTLPGTDWHPWMYFRELVQLGLVALSLQFGSHRVRVANNFTYAAIIEVAALFVGIFVCMQPALQILGSEGAALVERFQWGAQEFFWATGALSSFLDNAPTYLVFFKTVQDPSVGGPTGGVDALMLTAISLGAVFMGAMTYIGNGPNFMVKAIAETSGVRMPSFFGYMAYSCGILLPILALTAWFFLG